MRLFRVSRLCIIVALMQSFVTEAHAAGVPRLPLEDLGRAPTSMPVHLTLVLKLPRQRELDALVKAQGDLRSPLADRALTAREFRDYFAPTAAEYNHTAQTLVRDGLRIERTYTNRTVIDVVGPVASVERTFSTELHRVRYGAFFGYANLRPTTLPTDLATSVLGVAGFDNLPILHPDNVRGYRDPAKSTAGPPLYGPDTGFGPLALENAYDLPVLHGHGGKGQAAGIVIDALARDSDLKAFLKYFGVKRSGPLVHYIPVSDGQATYVDQGEATLDMSTIISLAPEATVYVYMVPILEQAYILDAYATANALDRVDALNSSFGGCETAMSTSSGSFPQMVDQLAEEGAALGIVYSASSGDSGAYDCEVYGSPSKQGLPALGVQAPADSPNVVAVGGTTVFLTSAGQRRAELAWVGSGGGYSSIFSAPNYQQGIAGVGKFRSVPDIAFDANPGSGLSFYLNGAWQGPVGGTSLASPIFTALVTELDEMAGHRITTMHAALYGTFLRHRYATKEFYDITQGSNGYYWAKAGFDQVTGIGSIDGWNFSQNGASL